MSRMYLLLAIAAQDKEKKEGCGTRPTFTLKFLSQPHVGRSEWGGGVRPGDYTTGHSSTWRKHREWEEHFSFSPPHTYLLPDGPGSSQIHVHHILLKDSLPSWMLLLHLNFSSNLTLLICHRYYNVIQFSFVAQSCPTLCDSTLCDSMDCSTPGLPVHHQLPEFTQTHVHWVSDAI